jgi:hypothetical protein
MTNQQRDELYSRKNGDYRYCVYFSDQGQSLVVFARNESEAIGKANKLHPKRHVRHLDEY